MNRKVILGILLIIVGLILPVRVFAHPIDISSYVLSVPSESNNGLYVLPLTWSLTIPEASTIVHPPLPDYEQLEVPLATYLTHHLKVRTDNSLCELKTDPLDISITTIDFSLLSFQSSIICHEEPKNLFIEITAFIQEFPAQTNILLLTKGDNTVFTQELTSIKTSTKYPDEGLFPQQNPQKTQPVSTGSLTSYFQKTLEDLVKTSLLGAIVVSFIVGFLHSLEAGHSKAILTSFMIQNQATIRHGLSYSLIFTVTHIADILLFGTILMIVGTFTDIYSVISKLNIYATYMLVWVSLYILFRNISEFRSSHEHTHEELNRQVSFKQQIIYGFLTGLAPCAMGWSIFLLIISTKTIWAVIPIIISFGCGIYLSLFLLTFAVYLGKKRVLSKATFLIKFSPIISSLLLFLFSLLLLLKK